MNIINLDKIKIRISEKLLQKLILDLLGFGRRLECCWEGYCNICKYIEIVSKKAKSRQPTSLYATVVKATNDPLTETKLNVFVSMANKLNTRFNSLTIETKTFNFVIFHNITYYPLTVEALEWVNVI